MAISHCIILGRLGLWYSRMQFFLRPLSAQYKVLVRIRWQIMLTRIASFLTFFGSLGLQKAPTHTTRHCKWKYQTTCAAKWFTSAKFAKRNVDFYDFHTCSIVHGNGWVICSPDWSLNERFCQLKFLMQVKRSIAFVPSLLVGKSLKRVEEVLVISTTNAGLS